MAVSQSPEGVGSVEVRPVAVAPDRGGALCFGAFVLDRERRQVRGADGVPLALTARLFNALELFVTRPGELIGKDALMQALWPGRVVEENSLSQLIHALRRALGDDGEARRYIQTEARRGFRLVVPVAPARADEQTMSSSSVRATLAVLPFVSLNAATERELLEVGMADSLIARLSIVPGLVLRSVASVRRYADPARDALAAGRTLDVDWLLDGTLQHTDDHLRVNARLLALPAGTAVWSGSFNTAFTNVFDVQDVISEQVAREVAPPLAGQTPWAPVRAAQRLGGTRDIDAYQLYLAASQQAQGVQAEGLGKSVELYRQALAVDPHYALARVGLAESCRRMVFGADADPRDALARPRSDVLAALEVAPDLAEAHAQLAWIQYWYDYDWVQAERSYRRALALNPNVVNAHFGLGFMLVTQGRCDEGLRHVRTARELDPMSLLIQTMEAAFIADHGDVAAGGAQLQRVLQIEPRFWIAHLGVAAIHFDRGEFDAAIDAAQRSRALNERSTQPVALLGAALAHAGRRDEARKQLASLQEQARTRYVPPTSLACVHAALGETEAALDALEQAHACRDTRLVYLKDDRRWRTLKGEPRYRALLERMDLHRFRSGLNGP